MRYPNQTPPSEQFPGEGGVIPIVTSHGSKPHTGIVWVITRVPDNVTDLRLRAYNAKDLTKPRLFDAPIGKWSGSGAFLAPVVANGKVYVASEGAYCLRTQITNQTNNFESWWEDKKLVAAAQVWLPSVVLHASSSVIGVCAQSGKLGPGVLRAPMPLAQFLQVSYKSLLVLGHCGTLAHLFATPAFACCTLVTGGPVAGQVVEVQSKDGATHAIWRVIAASAAGTMIEWYDFYIFGSLTAVLSQKFYPPKNETFAYIAYLATFAVGFVVRPFGALFFGRIGDLVGRKYAFLATLSIMGGSTALIGLMPTFETAGWFSPIALIVIRVLQGLALGGEYGGAAVYVGEHSPDDRRGFNTSFIQITAILGLLASLLAILTSQTAMSPESFTEWGWRIPFLLSVILVAVSLYIRSSLRESPVFAQLKIAKRTSAQPLKEAFAKWSNLRQVLVTLFGATAGQGVLSYTGQLYSLFFLQAILKVNPRTATILVAVAIALGMPFFTLFGALSDKFGRKWIMMTACLLAACSYLPIYHLIQGAAGNQVVTVKSTRNEVTGAISLTPLTRDATGALIPAKESANPQKAQIVFLIFVQMVYVGMVYGPIAAYLVEAFPAKIRYTSLSLPYHLGNGIFGGLMPLIGLSICAATGHIYAGLYYPIAVALLTFVVGSLALRETHGIRIWDEVAGLSIESSTDRSHISR